MYTIHLKLRNIIKKVYGIISRIVYKEKQLVLDFYIVIKLFTKHSFEIVIYRKHYIRRFVKEGISVILH